MMKMNLLKNSFQTKAMYSPSFPLSNTKYLKTNTKHHFMHVPTKTYRTCECLSENKTDRRQGLQALAQTTG